MLKKYCLLLTVCIISFPYIIMSAHENKKIVIVTTSYKNSNWYKKNLDSIFLQKYQKWHLIYTDDCSPDNTGALVAEYVKEKKQEANVTLICNKERKKALANIVHSISLCQDSDIVVSLDGDDWFAHPYVLSHINHAYQNPTVWMTYGTFMLASATKKTSWLHAYPKEVQEGRTFRQYKGMLPSHLRTFYAGLFKKINIEDLQYEGHFFEMAWDVAMMIPMIEMASRHYKFINNVLYVYNDLNEINDHKVDGSLQYFYDLYIRKKPMYAELTTNPY